MNYKCSGLPLLTLLMLEEVACLVSAGRVNGGAALFDVFDDALFVYDEGGARRVAALFVEQAVVFDGRAMPVAQKRKGYADVLSKPAVGGEAVHADAENLRVGGAEFGDIRLIRLQFLRSTTREGEHVESEHHILLAAKVAELNGLAFRVVQREVGRNLPDLQLRLGSLLRKTRGARGDEQRTQAERLSDHSLPLLILVTRNR